VEALKQNLIIITSTLLPHTDTHNPPTMHKGHFPGLDWLASGWLSTNNHFMVL